jgi:DNA-binding NarL/FixJ family response regulator
VGTFVVVEGDPSGRAARAALNEFDRPWSESWDAASASLCTSAVHTADDAHQVVLAALAGADLVVDCRAPREVIDEMCDDLRRLGRLDHRVVRASPLDDDQRQLLVALAAGRSLGSAAQELHVSRRTADRRVAAARAELGAATTAEAIVKATQLGLLD